MAVWLRRMLIVCMGLPALGLALLVGRFISPGGMAVVVGILIGEMFAATAILIVAMVLRAGTLSIRIIGRADTVIVGGNDGKAGEQWDGDFQRANNWEGDTVNLAAIGYVAGRLSGGDGSAQRGRYGGADDTDRRVHGGAFKRAGNGFGPGEGQVGDGTGR